MQTTPKERHCLIVFYENRGILEPIKEYLIEDILLLSEIIKIGFTRKDMQSLFKSDKYEYLTSDSVYLNKEHSVKDKISLNFIEKYLKSINHSLPKKSDCFDFSFPREMFDKKLGLSKISQLIEMYGEKKVNKIHKTLQGQFVGIEPKGLIIDEYPTIDIESVKSSLIAPSGKGTSKIEEYFKDKNSNLD